MCVMPGTELTSLASPVCNVHSAAKVLMSVQMYAIAQRRAYYSILSVLFQPSMSVALTCCAVAQDVGDEGAHAPTSGAVEGMINAISDARVCSNFRTRSLTQSQQRYWASCLGRHGQGP